MLIQHFEVFSHLMRYSADWSYLKTKINPMLVDLVAKPTFKILFEALQDSSLNPKAFFMPAFVLAVNANKHDTQFDIRLIKIYQLVLNDFIEKGKEKVVELLVRYSSYNLFINLMRHLKDAESLSDEKIQNTTVLVEIKKEIFKAFEHCSAYSAINYVQKILSLQENKLVDDFLDNSSLKFVSSEEFTSRFQDPLRLISRMKERGLLKKVFSSEEHLLNFFESSPEIKELAVSLPRDFWIETSGAQGDLNSTSPCSPPVALSAPSTDPKPKPNAHSLFCATNVLDEKSKDTQLRKPNPPDIK